MEQNPVAKHVLQAGQSVATLMAYLSSAEYLHRSDDPANCDFVFGNPNDMPLPGFVDALQKWSVPHNKDWFAYKLNEPESRHAVVESLLAWRGVRYDPEDVFLTTGAFGALAVSIYTLVNPGDEVIFISPPWFFYAPMILNAGGVPVRVKVDERSMEPTLEDIEAAITRKTRAIIINTPNNPTGKIYSESLLSGLGKLLTHKSHQIGHAIYLISDESYSKILFDGRKHISPTTYYSYAILVYTYGKTLLTPGQRIGYLVLQPNMPERESLREGLFLTQMLTGYAIPNALLQHALPDLDRLSIDIPRIQLKRDRMVAELRQMGYELHEPEGTFYLLVKSPEPDDVAFTRRLSRQKVLCLPGTVAEMPGYFRISLTATEEMIERSLPGFRAAIERVRA